MATTTQSILNRVAAILNDEEFERWKTAELIEWLNDGQRVIARGPTTDAYVLRTSITVAAGTVQSLPDDGIRLINVIRNVADGSAIRQSDYAIVDMLRSTWRSSSTAAAEVFFYDERNPKQFELFPPQVGDEQVEILYNAVPPDASRGGNISIDDIYADVLVDYISYRAFAKDTEDVSSISRATAFYNAFLVGAGFRDATDAAIEPRRS